MAAVVHVLPSVRLLLARLALLLATLLRTSRKTVLYTGAGISVSAGIGQAAKGSASKGRSWANAEPTPTQTGAPPTGAPPTDAPPTDAPPTTEEDCMVCAEAPRRFALIPCGQ